jgi:hypothetical protein
MTESKMNEVDGTGPTGTRIEAEDEHVDGCVEDYDLDETEATLDVELPPARGGVEQPALPQS